MAGYDPADPITAFSIGRIPRSYTELLSPDALKGARIGVMMNLFGREARHEDVNRVMEDVIAKVASLGATVIRFDLAEYDKLAPVVATSQYEARTVMERYFAALGPNVPIRSFADLVATKKSVVQKTLESELAVVDGMNSRDVQGPHAQPRQAAACARDEDGGSGVRRGALPAAEDSRRARHRRGSARAQRHAFQRHRLSGRYVPGWILVTDAARRPLASPSARSSSAGSIRKRSCSRMRTHSSRRSSRGARPPPRPRSRTNRRTSWWIRGRSWRERARLEPGTTAFAFRDGRC